MKYRLRADLILDIDDTATQALVIALINSIKGKLQRINPMETSSFTVEECYHDETPPAPCRVLFSYTK